MTQEFTGRKAMGAIGSPVALITGAHDGQRGIMTANMIAGVSFSPPLTAISMSHHSFTRSLIEASGEFAMHIISPELLDVARLIGTSTGRKIDKFQEFDIETFSGEATSCPLLRDAVTALECKVEGAMDIGKHYLYVGRVVAYHEIKQGSPLYLYHGQYYSIGKKLGSFKGSRESE